MSRSTPIVLLFEDEEGARRERWHKRRWRLPDRRYRRARRADGRNEGTHRRPGQAAEQQNADDANHGGDQSGRGAVIGWLRGSSHQSTLALHVTIRK